MNAYAELRKRQQAEFDALPLGAAFSDKQFFELMKRWGLDAEKDRNKIYRLPGGMFIKKKDAALLDETMARHDREIADAIAADKTGEGFIRQMFFYELRNHEYSYTGNLEETLDALGYTTNDILADKRLKHGLELAKEKLNCE